MATTAGSLIVKIGAEIRDFEKNLSKADRMLVKTADSMAATGKRMTLALTAPLLAVGAGMAKMAADAEESASKFQSVFGQNAKAMDAWIQSVRRSIPQTTAQLRDVTSSVQALLVPMGMTSQAAMDLGKQFTVLGADLASFYNIPVEQALTALRSGLVGEYEPLRQFGVSLNAATVEQEALRMGLVRTKAELTAGTKAQAAWSIVLKSTAMAQGDAARTANSTANQMKFAKANAEEAAHAFGELLTPALGATARFMANLGRTLADTSTTTRGVIIGVAGIAAAIGPVTWAVGGMIAGFVKLKAAVAGLSAVLGVAGLSGMLITGGVLLVGLTLLGSLIWKSGEAARQAKREIEGFKLSLAGVTDTAALGQQIAGLEQARAQYGAQLSAKRAQRDAIPADAVTRVSNPNAPGTFIETPARMRLDREVAQLERHLATINTQLDESRRHQKVLTSQGGGGGGGRGGGITTGRSGAGPLAPTWFGPLGQLQALPEFMASQRARSAAWRPGLNTNGLAPLGAGTVDLSAEFEEMRQKYEDASKTMGSHIVGELKAVPAAIAQNLAQFLGPVLAKWGAGAATGGLFGSTIGTAIGTGIGNRMGGVMGSVMGPLGGIAGTFLGGAIGAGLGKLFGKPKDRADEAAEAMRRLATTAQKVNEQLSNVPQGFKVAYARFMASTPQDAPGTTPPTQNGGSTTYYDQSASGAPVAGSSGGVTIAGPVYVQGVQDIRSLADELRAEAERQALRGGGTGLALGYAG